MNQSTVEFIKGLGNLQPGDLGILRQHRGLMLDESLAGFDLFSGLWWPLRSKNKAAPRREIAWLVAKLFAEFRFEQRENDTLPRVMGIICSKLEPKRELPRVLNRFDQLLATDVLQLEQPLARVLGILRAHHHATLDWVRLTEDLSHWEDETTRSRWTDIFMTAYNINKENKDVD